MAHFAKVVNDIVVDVIVAEQEFIDSYVDNTPGEWIKTSFNTREGVHYQPGTDTPSEDQSKALRKNFAGIGYSYDRVRDAFIPPKPYASWVLEENSCTWRAPLDMPSDELTFGKYRYWDEEAYQADNSTGWKTGNVDQ